VTINPDGTVTVEFETKRQSGHHPHAPATVPPGTPIPYGRLVDPEPSWDAGESS
jgi:hypothetical protein